MCLTPPGRTGSSGGSGSASRSAGWTRGSPSPWSPGRYSTWAAPTAGYTRTPGPAALPIPTISDPGATIRARKSHARAFITCAGMPVIRPTGRSWPGSRRSRRWSAPPWTGPRPCGCWAMPRRSPGRAPISPSGSWFPGPTPSFTAPGAAICGPCPRRPRIRTRRALLLCGG